ncbi:hypothetical protein OE88DRAFT_1290201 [Heliocybe sulcata]|uniref:Uncharacterized protein n=1 Tax=Heliocybe sulcata TaxID=5364 RepID=A0A5C3NBM8_9AGAM|nr:hypothetical protein OE88DRAFT_1290201 [Heliocybe sulcata]
MSATFLMTASNQPLSVHPTSSQRNKSRLYILFSLSSSSLSPSLVIAPKKPDPRKVQTWRFGLKHHGSFEGRQVVNYDQRMVAAVSVSKLDPEVTSMGLSMLFSREVPVRGGAREWVCDAINMLVEKDIIPPLPLSAHSIFEKGSRFAESVQASEKSGEESSVPTCDVEGTRIRSEISRV